ncbi:MAG: efflux RND transporter periplasmic adaptor subunit [Phycisphaerae bacterium]|nr:efflux RND transporter periplasmic adaptor subunit [Tepidisphaeraceae bacterium]
MTFKQLSGVAIVLSCGLLASSGCKKAEARPTPPPPTVTVAVPITREVLDYDEYTGKVAAVEEVEVRARVRGYLEAIGFKDGEEVEKDRVLFSIDPKPFEATLKVAQGQVEQLKSRKIKYAADVKRYQELVPKGAASAQDLDKAIGELGEAAAGISSAEAEVERAKLDVAYAKVLAPIPGMISKANLTVGNLIGAGSGDQLLTTIVRMDPMHVYFDVDQRAAQRYRAAAVKKRAGQPEPKSVRDLNIPFQFGLASEDGFGHTGVIDFIDNKVDPTTGTISIRGEVDNKARLLRPGFFARVRVAAGDKYQAVLVAERAIGTQQGQKYVLVVDAKDAVVFRPVELGAPQADGLRVVRSGLAAGERIVVNGMQRARPGSAVKAVAGEMLPPSATSRPAATAPAAPTPAPTATPAGTGGGGGGDAR